MDVGADIN